MAALSCRSSGSSVRAMMWFSPRPWDVARRGISVVIHPCDAPYSYAEIRGTATLTTEGGQELINELSRKYTGKNYAEFNPAFQNDAERIVVRITPRKIVGSL